MKNYRIVNYKENETLYNEMKQLAKNRWVEIKGFGTGYSEQNSDHPVIADVCGILGISLPGEYGYFGGFHVSLGDDYKVTLTC